MAIAVSGVTTLKVIAGPKLFCVAKFCMLPTFGILWLTFSGPGGNQKNTDGTSPHVDNSHFPTSKFSPFRFSFSPLLLFFLAPLSFYQEKAVVEFTGIHKQGLNCSSNHPVHLSKPLNISTRVHLIHMNDTSKTICH